MGVAESGTLHHTAWVVRDLDATAGSLAEALGIQWSVWTIEPEVCFVHGRETPYAFEVALAQIGESSLELIRPVHGDSVYVEHLESFGEGFHHTCILYDSLEAMHRAKEELDAQGRELIQLGGLGDAGEFCYFATPETGGALELLFLKELPPPDRTIG